jgi:UDP-glucose 4-epimerase
MNSFRSIRSRRCFHFAGLKAVGESVEKPAEYHANNVGGTRSLLDAMQRHACSGSSSAPRQRYTASPRVFPTPRIIRCARKIRMAKTRPRSSACSPSAQDHPGLLLFRAALLQPDRAHPSGRSERIRVEFRTISFPMSPRSRSARGPGCACSATTIRRRTAPACATTSTSWTFVAGHLSALRYLEERQRSITVNLGTGQGHSVLEVVRAFERVTGACGSLRIHAAPRRRHRRLLGRSVAGSPRIGWRATRGLEEMCRDAWRWQSMNPAGYSIGFL